MQIVLASASPRRKELFKEIFTEFEIIPAHGEERVDPHLPPSSIVQQLAKQKAEEVQKRLQGTTPLPLILGADTVVAYDGKILGKPATKQEAEEMLSALSGNKHEVLTGVCFLYTDGTGNRKELTAFERTEVEFYPLSPAFIKEYVASGSPMDKAGAYGIQDGGLVKSICGSYSNVVGLPVELCQTLKQRILLEQRGVL